MLTTNSLPFLPAGRALRQHRLLLQGLLTAEPAVHLLPGLLSLPLGVEPLPDPAAIMAGPALLGLAGAPTSGRSLALLQVAQRWASSGAPGAVLYLPLVQADAPNLSPRAVIAGAVHRAGLPPALADGARPGVLLLDDWELLSADRRAVWRAALTSSAQAWPALHAVVALPAGERWDDLALVELPAPDEARAAAWLAHLLPGHDTAPLVAALRGEPLARLRSSLADIALLALTYPLAGMPAGRTELYEQAYALVRPLAAEANIGRAALRHYRLARSLAGGDDLETLASLAPTERAAVAPLAAGLLDDPLPVLTSLWGDGTPDQADLRALAACALESPARAPLWGLRLAERLASPEAPEAERALLHSLAPALPALLAAAAQADEPRALAAAAAVARALVGTGELWLTLVDDLSAPPALRWLAADLLAAAPPAPEALAPPSIADATTLAARCFVAALGGEATQRLLATSPFRAGLEALLSARHAGERRARAARAIVSSATLPEQLRALALAAVGDPQLVERTMAGGSADMRRAALAELEQREPEEALAAIYRVLAALPADDPARREALDAAARLSLPAATALLARAALGGHGAQPGGGDDRRPATADRTADVWRSSAGGRLASESELAVRLHAVDLLAGRGPGGRLLLRRLMGWAGLPVMLRAAAAGHLGRLGATEALPDLRGLLETSDAPLLRRAAAGALGALGARESMGDQVARALITGLRRVGVDTALGERIARALGHTGANMALPTLAALLGPQLEAALRGAWLRRLPDLATQPATAWPSLARPNDARLALMDALADGGTTADPPTSLGELTARQATRIAVAACAALGDLVERRPDLAPMALVALRAALADPARTEVVRAALDMLARIGDPAAELVALLDNPSAPTVLRWLALERLGAAPAARELALRRLELGADDLFLQSAIIGLLGAHAHQAALPSLRRLARGAEQAPQLRRAAVAALGRLSGPEATEALLAIAADPTAPGELRCAAADALPAELSGEPRAALRQAARAARQQPEPGLALARALARAGDHEALPALVRHSQSAQGAEAVASIEAITALGDASTTPLLVRISQSPTAAPGVRLAAVSALLRVGGDEYLPLLREYLAAASPPLRMQAYAALAATRPDDPRLGEPLADPAAPLTLRLQALRHVSARTPDDRVIGLVVTNPAEQPQLRLAAAAALGFIATAEAVAALSTVLEAATPQPTLAAPVLRQRCVESLGALARPASPASASARAALTGIVADAGQPPEHRQWAAERLLRY